jgi:hypothetical protein
VSEQLLRQMQDRVDLASLKFQYCRAADAMDVQAMTAIFTDDCLVRFAPDGSRDMRGREQLADFYRTALGPVAASSHHVSNLDIIFDGADRARMHCYLYSWQRLRGYPELADRHRWARYEDAFVRTADGWRQSELHMVVAGELSEAGPRIGEVVGRPIWPGRSY